MQRVTHGFLDATSLLILGCAGLVLILVIGLVVWVLLRRKRPKV